MNALEGVSDDEEGELAGEEVAALVEGDGERRWTPAQRQVQQWLATPRPERRPATMTELGRRLGTYRQTIWRWRQHPGFMEEVWRIANLEIGDRLPEVLEAVVQTALGGRSGASVQAARLLLEVTGRLALPSTTYQTAVVFNASDIAEAARRLAEFEAQRPDTNTIEGS